MDKLNYIWQQILTDEEKRHGLSQLQRDLLSDEEDKLSCEECRHLIPTLYELQKHNEEMPETVKSAISHLQQCNECANGYAALNDAISSYEAGTLPDATDMPQFDFSFLQMPNDESEVPISTDFVTTAPKIWVRDVGNTI